MIDFKIDCNGIVSQYFMGLGYTQFATVANFIKNLPYQRNTNKNDILSVVKDKYGTCSTKHAFLAELIAENKQNIDLVLGIFKMDANYSNAVGKVLAKYNLPYIPEAHNYLSYEGIRYDYTNPTSSPKDFEDKLITEQNITPNQITDYKVQFHKKVLKKWIDDEQQPYSLVEIWAIREECMAALSNN